MLNLYRRPFRTFIWVHFRACFEGTLDEIKKLIAEPRKLFYSSDVEFSPVQKKFRNAGLKSIVSMRDTLFEDRISSEKRVRGTLHSTSKNLVQSIW